MSKKCSAVKREILEMIAASGEVYRQDLMNVSRYAANYIRQILGELRADNLIKESIFNNCRTIRLTNIGKKYMLQMALERYERYLSGTAETNKLRCEPQRRERNLKMAQIIILLRQTKVTIFPDEKRLLYKHTVPPADKADDIQAEFYTSTELKELFADFNKSRGSRAMGILITASCVYIVYHTGMEPMKWQESTELKFRITVEHEIVRKAFRNQKELKWLVVGNSTEIPDKLAQQSGAGKIKYMNISDNNLEKHYVEFRRESLPVMRLIADDLLCEKVRGYIRQSCGIWQSGSGQFCETDGAGTPVLLALDFNMQRVHRFAAYLCVNNKKGRMICFDFQERYLHLCCGALMDVYTIDSRKYEEGILYEKNN